MATELNLDDYTGEFLKKVGNIEDFSREFLVKLAHVYEDTLVWTYYAQTTTFAKKVGLHEAWDVAGEMSRSNLRQVMPMARYVAPLGWDWKNAQYQAAPFDCQADDLTKEGLIKLIKTYWDQYLKVQNLWLDKWVAKVAQEEVWKLQADVYKLIVDYEYPKLAKLFQIKPNTVVNCIKLANLSIDGTSGYGGEWEVIDPDHVVLKMYKCEVLQKYLDEGLYPPERAWLNCKAEVDISENFFPGCKLDIKRPPPDLKVPPGEPFCVWTYTKKAKK
jgi:hypothetical protein